MKSVASVLALALGAALLLSGCLGSHAGTPPPSSAPTPTSPSVQIASTDAAMVPAQNATPIPYVRNLSVDFNGSLPAFVEVCSWDVPEQGCRDLPPGATFNNRWFLDLNNTTTAPSAHFVMTWESGAKELGIRVSDAANPRESIAVLFGPSPLKLNVAKLNGVPGHHYVINGFSPNQYLTPQTYVAQSSQDQAFRIVGVVELRTTP